MHHKELPQQYLHLVRIVVNLQQMITTNICTENFIVTVKNRFQNFAVQSNLWHNYRILYITRSNLLLRNALFCWFCVQYLCVIWKKNYSLCGV